MGTEEGEELENRHPSLGADERGSREAGWLGGEELKREERSAEIRGGLEQGTGPEGSKRGEDCSDKS